MRLCCRGTNDRIQGEILEAPPGFEPGMEVLQTSALPLGYGASLRGGGGQCGGDWSGKRDSNPRLRPWQGRTLPLSYSRSCRATATPKCSTGPSRARKTLEGPFHPP